MVFRPHLSVNVTEISQFTEQRSLHPNVKLSAIVLAASKGKGKIKEFTKVALCHYDQKFLLRQSIRDLNSVSAS